MANEPTPVPGVFLPALIAPVRTIGSRKFDFGRQVAVMAIVNRTPDSFHDRGATYALDRAVAAVVAAAEAGADLVDIGGVPFGLHAGEISAEQEIDRVVPVVAAARAASDVAISVDTYRPEVAERALAAGADVINDTTGLYYPQLADIVAGSGATLVITHSLASPPRTAVIGPSYRDVTAEVAAFLSARVEVALDRGVRPEQLIIDPGHDLNKNTFHSLELTRRLSEITAIGYPTLAALSNKDFIGESLDAPQQERLSGTIAANTIAILAGARLIRVHEVVPAVHTVHMVEAILGWRTPANPRHNIARP